MPVATTESKETTTADHPLHELPSRGTREGTPA